MLNYKLTVIFVSKFIRLQITIEVQAYIQDVWKTVFEAKLTKGQSTIFTNRFVNYLF